MFQRRLQELSISSRPNPRESSSHPPSRFIEQLNILQVMSSLQTFRPNVTISPIPASCPIDLTIFMQLYSLLHVRKITISLISKATNCELNNRDSIPVTKEVVFCSPTGGFFRPPKNLKDPKWKLFSKLTESLMSFLRSLKEWTPKQGWQASSWCSGEDFFPGVTCDNNANNAWSLGSTPPCACVVWLRWSRTDLPVMFTKFNESNFL
jgi:hypothetical protein